jgi:hypothetical protein
MGETGGADVRDPLNSYLNPGVLSLHSGVQVTGFHSDVHDFNLRRQRGLDVALGFRFPISSSFDVHLGGELRVEEMDWKGGGFFGGTIGDGYTSVSLGSAVGLAMGFAVGVGMTIKDWHLHTSPTSEWDVTAYDIGAIMSQTVGQTSGANARFSVGISRINVWSDAAEPLHGFTELESTTNLALAIGIASSRRPLFSARVPGVEFGLNGDVNFEPYDYKTYRVGIETAIMKIVFLRAGWIKEESFEISTIVGGGGIGIPSRWIDLRFDYAIVPIDYLGTNQPPRRRDHRFSLVLTSPFES